MRVATAAIALLAVLSPAFAQPASPPNEVLVARPEAWVRDLLAAHGRCATLDEADLPARAEAWRALEKRHPIESDWLLREWGADCGLRLGRAELPATLAGLSPGATDAPSAAIAWASRRAERRATRLAELAGRCPAIVFVKHAIMGGSHYAYTEAVSDGIYERNFHPGSALCLLRLEGAEARIETLLADPGGVIRDPDVSWDGRRVLFSWKKSDRGDDYHLYEMDLDTRAIRQLTHGLGHADYEGVYLPDGAVVFNSTRCVQAVDCWWTEVSNLYRLEPEGRIRRLTYDQVHDNFPTVAPDGRVLYTRWEYNDRGQIFPQPLYRMNPDGSAQEEAYGASSWFPTTILHARGVPGSERIVAIATGHHSMQTGKLLRLDPRRGMQEADGAELLAPRRPAEPVRIDAYGQEGELFQYPWPLGEEDLLVSYSPGGWYGLGIPEWLPESTGVFEPRLGIYWMDSEGERELLAADPGSPCAHPVPLQPRTPPPARPSLSEAGDPWAMCLLSEADRGPSLAGVPAGTVRAIRVVALDYRAAAIRENGSEGPGGAALASTPISIGNGSWDVKRVLGEVPVGAEGSVAFRLPARTPVYFQALDANGRAIQTMRSWTTLQPGERASCVGCHEPRSATPAPASFARLAGEMPSVALEAPGFSFPREVQPILDRHCVSCHSDRSATRPGVLTPERVLRRGRQLLPTGATWRYTTEDPGDGWMAPGFGDARWSVGRASFGLEGTPSLEIRTEWSSPALWLRTEFEVPGDLVGRDLAVIAVHDEDLTVWVNGVEAARGEWYVVAPTVYPASAEAARTLHPGRNTLAVLCRQTSGGQGVDLSLHALAPRPTDAAHAFSLLGDARPEEISGRAWSDGYINLTGAAVYGPAPYLRATPGPFLSWASAQSVPTLLPARSVGSTASGLLAMIEAGHGGVALSDPEMRTLACWIDLAIPFCGDYREAAIWTAEERERYERALAKREAEERGQRDGRS